MNLLKKKGFTLIELLVVITIIGILATGGVAVYTSQIQKARDTTRINDIETLKSGVEQFYQDKSVYPSADTDFNNTVITYVPKFPKDPKSGQLCNKGTLTSATGCDYLYAWADDSNGIVDGEYKLSTGFENGGNITSKAEKDDGATDEKNRYEVGLNLTNAKSTICNRAATKTVDSGVHAVTTQCDAPLAKGLIISGN